MPVYVALCDCPNKHNIAVQPFEADAPGPDQREAMVDMLVSIVARAMLRGDVPRVCPYCFADRDTWEFSIGFVEGNRTLAEVEAACREASRLGREDAHKASRARMN